MTCKRDAAVTWDDVLAALEQLYEVWARHGAADPDTGAALDELMRAYDEWLG